MDITCIDWSLPDVKESHQIDILTVNITNDLGRGSNLLDDDWLSCQDLGTLVGKFNDVLSLAGELLARFDILTFFRLQKRLDEHLTKRIIWIFINLGMILLLRIQFLGLLCQFIN